MRVLIAPDKFKGTLTAVQAARAVAQGWRSVRPDDELELLPISDGGDGFGVVLAESLGATPVRCLTVDAAGRSCRAQWWWRAEGRVAVIESARVIGLAMLPAGRFHPFELDTGGLAAVLQAAVRRGAQRCLVGIGGSATNDGGFGLARGLGWQFLDRRGQTIESWTRLHLLTRLVPPVKSIFPRHIEVAVDVQNPLLGRTGCTRVYGPQKGLRATEFAAAERNLRQLARVVREELGSDVSVMPGAGAAGGLGFGLAAFAGVRLVPGFELVARSTGLVRRLARAELVITGEGRLDGSSFMGKGPGELARLCAARRVPCLGLAGDVAERRKLEKHFAWVGALTDFTSARAAQAGAARWLRKLAARAATDYRPAHAT